MLADILAEVRDFLADTDTASHRWSNEVLLRHLNRGLRDIALQTKTHKKYYSFPVVAGVATYVISDNIIGVIDAFYKGCKIAPSNKELTNCDSQPSTPTHWLYHRQKRGNITLYPTPDVTSLDQNTADSLYGTATTFDGTGYGIIVDISNYLTEVPLGSYGTLTSIPNPEHDMVVFVSSYLDKILTIESDIIIDPTWEQAAIHYMCGKCLRTDRDTQSVNLGNTELALYSEELKKIKQEVSINHADVDRQIDYRTIENG